MSKCLFHWRTALGPRTVIAEISDPVSAQACINAHLALGEMASICPEATRVNLKSHLAAHTRSRERAKIKLVASDPKVVAIRKAKKP